MMLTCGGAIRDLSAVDGSTFVSLLNWYRDDTCSNETAAEYCLIAKTSIPLIAIQTLSNSIVAK
jgi:hypothetical protein